MGTAQLDTLAKTAANIAMNAAAKYIRHHNLKVVDYNVACDCLKGWIKLSLPQALEDAKAALDANMSQIAQTTFRASMAQAGIEAAKEFGFPMDYQP